MSPQDPHFLAVTSCLLQHLMSLVGSKRVKDQQGRYLGPLRHRSESRIWRVWRGKVQEVGVKIDCARPNEEVSACYLPDTRQEMSAPGHRVCLVSILLCSARLIDVPQKTAVWSAVPLLAAICC